MKKLLSLLGSFGLIASTATTVVSCGGLGNLRGLFSNQCYDESWFDVTDKDSDQKQWNDIFILTLLMDSLPKEDVPDSTSFFKLDHQEPTYLLELLKKSLKDDSDKEDQEELKKLHFELDFTFLITNYDPITGKVIDQMKEKLSQENSGTYLFLNLPSIIPQKIQYEQKIDFEYLFLTKDDSGLINNNKNNEWFYWYQNDCRNRLFPNPDKKGQYFFNLLSYANTKRVVKPVTPQEI